MRLWPVLAICSLVVSQELTIYTKNIETLQESDLGILSYDAARNESFFKISPSSSLHSGSYSICARDSSGPAGPAPGLGCFGYQEINENTSEEFGGMFKVKLREDGDLENVSFERSAESSLIWAKLQFAVEAPLPNLNPFHKKAQQDQPQVQTQKVTRKRVVENEEGEKVEVEEEFEEVVEVDNRSWIQKNWMYIVPPLVLFLIFSPDEKKEGESQ